MWWNNQQQQPTLIEINSKLHWRVIFLFSRIGLCFGQISTWKSTQTRLIWISCHFLSKLIVCHVVRCYYLCYKCAIEVAVEPNQLCLIFSFFGLWLMSPIFYKMEKYLKNEETWVFLILGSTQSTEHLLTLNPHPLSIGSKLVFA